MQLIVDSGSTKTTWCAVLSYPMSFTIQTSGINPVRDDEKTIRTIIKNARAAIETEIIMGRTSSLVPSVSFGQVFFYGAGCIPPYCQAVHSALQQAFPDAAVCVESDLLGAARALCGHSEGIACILGTGSNSCLYDGLSIVLQVSPLGWILGDEGSGAVLGRTLVGDLLKGQMPSYLRESFENRFNLNAAAIIDAVYRQPQPNRFLASLVPFLAENRAETAIHDFLIRQFRQFLVRNVATYQRRDLPVNFVGGVAYQFENELREASQEESFDVGIVERSPMERLIRFHLSS
jgi:N-acetylglucosamine kinase-like BadF-type ATPase